MLFASPGLIFLFFISMLSKLSSPLFRRNIKENRIITKPIAILIITILTVKPPDSNSIEKTSTHIDFILTERKAKCQKI